MYSQCSGRPVFLEAASGLMGDYIIIIITNNKYRSGYLWLIVIHHVLYTPYILWGFYFCEFRESGATREINKARKNIYLRSRRMNATCIHSARARRMILLVLYWLLRSLLSLIANLTTRENVLSSDSQNIWRIQYFVSEYVIKFNYSL